jgi:L-lactate utilization protein LutB
MRAIEESFRKKYELSAARVVKNLQNRNFEAFYCGSKGEAVEKAMSFLAEGSTVSWGGSMTLYEIGLIDRIYQSGVVVFDRDKAQTREERLDMSRRAFFCDNYLASVNALSEDGVLVNIDGIGNRVAAIAFGPQNVVLIAGMNKVCKTLEDARARARNHASPLNVQRLAPLKTPCALTGTCADCQTDDCICSYIVETRMCKPKGRIKIILVGESLGF